MADETIEIKEEPKIYTSKEAIPLKAAALECYKRTKATLNLGMILFFLPPIIYFCVASNKFWSAGMIVLSVTLATTYIFRTTGELIRLEDKYGLDHTFMTNLFRRKK